MADDLEDTMLAQAAKPAEISTNAGTVKQRPLSELQALDEYVEAKKATKKKNLGLQFRKIIPPGAD